MNNGKVYIHFLVDEDFKKQLMDEAKRKQLSLNSYIRLILLARKENL